MRRRRSSWAMSMLGVGALVAACGSSDEPCRSCCESAFHTAMRRAECMALGLQNAGPCGAACRLDSGVSVQAAPDLCPQIEGLDVGPLASDLGGRIHVVATALDPEGDALTYLWTAVDQTFANPYAADTFYRCVYPGTQTLMLVVSDGRCSVSQTIDVSCDL